MRATEEREARALEAWAALKGATTAVFNRVMVEQPPAGAQPGHMGYLHALGAAAGPMSPSDLAAALEVTPATVTGALTALEEAGLVERRRSSSDRRAVHVAITPAGRAAQRQWVDTIRRHVREGFAPLTDAELDDVVRLLGKVAPPAHGPPRGLLQALRHDGDLKKDEPKGRHARRPSKGR